MLDTMFLTYDHCWLKSKQRVKVFLGFMNRRTKQNLEYICNSKKMIVWTFYKHFHPNGTVLPQQMICRIPQLEIVGKFERC